mmetsp:Transcript_33946/g.112324  ORF Transcript_33946/g.112324 Transcript_33946/m.112324 type:complete len:513 (-) Transcript_33946:312-1850(-)
MAVCKAALLAPLFVPAVQQRALAAASAARGQRSPPLGQAEPAAVLRPPRPRESPCGLGGGRDRLLRPDETAAPRRVAQRGQTRQRDVRRELARGDGRRQRPLLVGRRQPRLLHHAQHGGGTRLAGAVYLVAELQRKGVRAARVRQSVLAVQRPEQPKCRVQPQAGGVHADDEVERVRVDLKPGRLHRRRHRQREGGVLGLQRGWLQPLRPHAAHEQLVEVGGRRVDAGVEHAGESPLRASRVATPGMRPQQRGVGVAVGREAVVGQPSHVPVRSLEGRAWVRVHRQLVQPLALAARQPREGARARGASGDVRVVRGEGRRDARHEHVVPQPVRLLELVSQGARVHHQRERHRVRQPAFESHLVEGVPRLLQPAVPHVRLHHRRVRRHVHHRSAVLHLAQDRRDSLGRVAGGHVRLHQPRPHRRVGRHPRPPHLGQHCARRGGIAALGASVHQRGVGGGVGPQAGRLHLIEGSVRARQVALHSEAAHAVGASLERARAPPPEAIGRRVLHRHA